MERVCLDFWSLKWNFRLWVLVMGWGKVRLSDGKHHQGALFSAWTGQVNTERGAVRSWGLTGGSDDAREVQNRINSSVRSARTDTRKGSLWGMGFLITKAFSGSLCFQLFVLPDGTSSLPSISPGDSTVAPGAHGWQLLPPALLQNHFSPSKSQGMLKGEKDFDRHTGLLLLEQIPCFPFFFYFFSFELGKNLLLLCLFPKHLQENPKSDLSR